jgi:hypothetical protein
MQTLSEQVAALRAVLPQVPAKDREFADNLLRQFNQKGYLSPRQAPWVKVLVDRASGVAPAAPETASVGSFQSVYAIFQAAAQKLKFPKIKLCSDAAGQVVLALSGKNSKTPGVINVTDGRPFGQNAWYGRVGADGSWTKPRVEYTNSPAVEAILRALASDPVKAVAEYGKLTGHCAFCGLPKNFGLWGAYRDAKSAPLAKTAKSVKVLKAAKVAA